MKNFFTKQGAVIFSLLFLVGIIFQPSVANATTSFATQLYTFDLSGQSNITKLHIDLIAYATASAGNGIVTKIWNNNSSAWETLSSLGNTASSMPGSSSSQEITSSITNYLDGSSKVNLLVSSLNPSVGGTEAVLYTDYVNLAVTAVPVVSSINPTTTSNINQIVSGIALSGQNFVAGATVIFKKTSQTDISCTNINVSSTTAITCDANFRGAVAGTWDIVVTNSDSTTGTLVSGLTITEATHPQFTSVGSNELRGSVNMVTSGARSVGNNVAPAVTGTATVGQTLSCSTGTWYGTPTINYTYQWQHGTTNIGSATSSAYVIDVAYVGETIRCVVTATNSLGSASVNSNNSGSVIGVPGAPTIGTATQTGGTTATVSFTAPASNGGATITTYTAYPSSGGGSGTLSQAGSGTITVTGLTAGTSYTFTVKATNSVGQGPASSASNGITTATVPGAPTIGTATQTGATTATVSFTAPASNGGATITTYTAYPSSGGGGGTLSQAGSGTINVTGLTAGTSYTFTVKATNSVGQSTASSASNSITTPTVPGAPTIGTATATGSTTATVSFTAPASNGGSTITAYVAYPSSGGGWGVLYQAGSGTITVTGLTRATSYTFTVKATNAVGEGAASSASNQITTSATVPGAPTIGTATITSGTTATVSFTAPGDNGGSTILHYHAYTGGVSVGTLTQAGSGTINVTGLTRGTAYTFTVKATNAVGEGAASSASNEITPADVPGAPIIGTATRISASSSTVSFTAPADDGGSPITSYQAWQYLMGAPQRSIGSLNQAGSGTINCSTPGTVQGTFLIVIYANNAIGESAMSSFSNSISGYNYP